MILAMEQRRCIWIGNSKMNRIFIFLYFFHVKKILNVPKFVKLLWNVHVGRPHAGFSLEKMNFSGYLLIVTLSGWDAAHICPMSAKIQLSFLTSNHSQPLTLEQWDKIWAGHACGLTSTRIIPGISVGQEPSGFNRKVSRNSVRGSCGTSHPSLLLLI